MRERLPLVGGFFLLALGILLGSIFIAGGIRDRNKNDTIAVTGSAKQRISSDYVIWDLSLMSQQATPQQSAAELDRWTTRVVAFLHQAGVQDSELTVQPVSAAAQQDFNKGGQITGYTLTRNFEVRSDRVADITGVVEQSSKLLTSGVPIQSQPVQYLYTKLPQLRPKLLALATQDALKRAKVLVDATGGHLGKLRSVAVGVFQVTAPNSTDVSDSGLYDTSTRDKDVTGVVNVTFALS
ncbi:MAG: SIMPL domain-containing protein [Gaiellaceae bacterium]